jgi:hypothetical protein
MSGRILQINFKFNVPRADYEKAVAPLADPVAASPGLIWKVWLMNESKSEAGGIYLFEDAQAVANYLATELVAGIVSHPALSDFSVKQFDPLVELCQVTHAPLVATMA